MSPISSSDSSFPKFSVRRHLASGDFDELNDLISDAVVEFPDSTVTDGILLSVDAKNLKCTAFQLDDLLLSYRQESSSVVSFDVEGFGLDLSCSLNFEYGSLFFFGSGYAEMDSFGNTVSASIIVESEDYDRYPPIQSSLTGCAVDISLDRVDFEGGGLLGLLPDSVKGLVSRLVEDLAGDFLCTKMTELSTTELVEILENVADFFEQYPENFVVDPLEMENDELTIPPSLQVLNLQEKETSSGEWVDWALKQGVSYLSETVEDPDLIGGTTMRLNRLLRNVLDEDGALTLNVDDVVKRGVLYEHSDRLTDTKATLNSIKLLGIDTCTKFNPFATIGKYTLQNDLAWEFLSIEADVTLEIKPSSRADSVISDPEADGKDVVERITIRVGFENLDATSSLLLAIRQETFEGIQLGAWMQADRVIPCALSTIFDLRIASLSVDASEVISPTLDGFVSRGIDRVVSDAVDAAALMYEKVLLRAAPAIFQTGIRNAVNNALAGSISKSRSDGVECPEIEVPGNSVIDLRDLLLTPSEALASGASGLEPYGTLFSSTLMPEFYARFVANDENGLPKLNSYIKDITKAQSGSDGVLRSGDDIVDVTVDFEDEGAVESLLTRLRLRVFDIRVRNLDTLVEPLSILSPSRDELDNEFRFGPIAGKPVVLDTVVLLEVAGNQSPLALRNEIRLRWRVPSFIVNLKVLATISERKLLELPFVGFSSIHCWMETFVENNRGPGLAALSFLTMMGDAEFEVECLSCTSPGGETLPSFSKVLGEGDIIDMFRERIGLHVEELFWKYYESLRLDRALNEAASLCPSSDAYSSSAVSSFRWPSFPSLSRQMVETVSMMVTTALYSTVIITMNSHSIREDKTTVRSLQENELLGWKLWALDISEKVLDWNDLNSTIGEWADAALEEARVFLNGSGQGNGNETEPGINWLIRQSLGQDGVFKVDHDDINYSFLGTDFVLKSTQVFGLDSVSNATLLVPTGAQSLANTLVLSGIQVILHFEIYYDGLNTVDMVSMSFALDEIIIDFTAFLALDLDRIGEIEIQSIMKSGEILPCFLSKVELLELSELEIQVGGFQPPELVGILPPQLNQQFLTGTNRLFETFREEFFRGLTIFGRTTFRESVNAVLSGYREGNVCVSLEDDSSTNFVDFRELFLSGDAPELSGFQRERRYGDTFSKVYTIMNNLLQKVDGNNRATLNDDLIVPLTLQKSNVSGNLVYEEDVANFNATFEISSLSGTVAVRLSDTRFENLDSIGLPLALLSPIASDPHSLNNTITLGVGDSPLRLAGRLSVDILNDVDLNVSNVIDINLDVANFTVFLAVFLPVSESLFASFPLEQATNLDCWLSLVSSDAVENSASLFGYGVAASDLDLDVSCVSCTSPDFDKLITQLYSPDKNGDASDFLNTTVTYLDSLVGSDFVSGFVSRSVRDAAKQCPSHPDYDADAKRGDFLSRPETYFGFDPTSRDPQMVLFNAVVGSFALFLFLVALAARFWLKRRRKQWRAMLKPEQLAAVELSEREACEREAFVNKWSTSMFNSEHIPPRIRHWAPIATLFNVGLYLGGHLGILSSINIHASVAGEPVSIYNFMDFSFFKSVVRTYSNGGNEMAILVMIFSGAFPYIKLLGSVVLWMLPPSRIPVGIRGSMFLWLDVLTKLSIIDIFMTAMGIAAVLVFIGGRDEDLRDTGELYSLRLEVVPYVSFYCILIAQRLNRTSSRFFYDYHEKIVKTTIEDRDTIREAQLTSKVDGESGRRVVETRRLSRRLSKVISAVSVLSEFDDDIVPEPEPSIWLQLRSMRPFKCLSPEARRKWTKANVAVCLAFATAIAMAAIGIAFSPSVSLEAKTFLSIAIETNRSFAQAVEDYNVFQVITLILVQARFVLDSTTDYIGLGILLAIAIILSVVFPATQGWKELKSWLERRRNRARFYENEDELRRKMEDENERLIEFINELKLWQNVEVYFFAYVVAVWQLGAVTAYAIHMYCVNLDKLYKALSYIGLVEDTSSQCFRIQVEDVRTISIILSSFMVLTATFVQNVMAQQKKNHEALRIATSKVTVGQ